MAHLLRHAMIHPSFIPPRSIRELRDLTRRRREVAERRHGAEKNRVQKVLEDANVKLGNVLSDVFGVSGQLMLDALLEWKSYSRPRWRRFAQRGARKKIPEIIQALEGQSDDRSSPRRMIRYRPGAHEVPRRADYGAGCRHCDADPGGGPGTRLGN